MMRFTNKRKRRRKLRKIISVYYLHLLRPIMKMTELPQLRQTLGISNKVTKLHHSQDSYSSGNYIKAEIPTTSAQSIKRCTFQLSSNYNVLPSSETAATSDEGNTVSSVVFDDTQAAVKKLHHSQGTHSSDNYKKPETLTTSAQATKKRKFQLSSNYNGLPSSETAPTFGEANDVSSVFFDDELPSTSAQVAGKLPQHNTYSYRNESAIFSGEVLSNEAPLQDLHHSQSVLFSRETPDNSLVSEPNKGFMGMLHTIEKRLQVLEENAIPKTDVMAHQKLLRESKVLIKSVHKMVCRISGESTNDLHSDLATIMPLQSLDAVIDFEEKLSEKNFEDAVTTYLFALKGSSGELSRVLKYVFTDEVIDLFNWGGSNGKKALSKLKVVKAALFEVFKLQGRVKFEDDFRTYITQSHNRSKQRRYLQKQNKN